MSRNHVKNIAIIGAAGRSGRAITEALLDANRFHVTALTRTGTNTSSFPSGLYAIKPVDYSSQDSLVSALSGQDVLIITLAVMAPPAVQTALIDAAVAAGVRYIMPNEWGVDLSQEALARDTMMWDRYYPVREHIERAAADKITSWIALSCGFWYEFSLAGTEARYGFDFDKKSVTLYSGGDVKIHTSTFAQVGRAVANLFSLPIEKDGSGPSLSEYADRAVYISSFHVSQNDMLDSVLRVTGDRREDWTIEHEDVQERFRRGSELMKQGVMEGFGILLYARTFYKDGSGSFGAKLDNEKLGLPKDDLDAATRIAVKMATAGETNAIH